MPTVSQKITPNLWFDDQAEHAAEYYTSLFPNSRIHSVTRSGGGGLDGPGDVLSVEFELDGHAFIGINGGPMFRFTEAVSFGISCTDQAEVDHYWDALIADGGEEGQCGWLKDRYGLSWQVVPTALPELLGDPDPGRAQRALQAMMTMRKLDIAALHAAADGSVPAGAGASG
jgi:predicted 3-demethylubiquinone-9 3-methyltransferase (glyoxalase superfamily)